MTLIHFQCSVRMKVVISGFVCTKIDINTAWGIQRSCRRLYAHKAHWYVQCQYSFTENSHLCAKKRVDPGLSYEQEQVISFLQRLQTIFGAHPTSYSIGTNQSLFLSW